MSTNENIEYLRTYVRGTYDIQKLRVAIGNRITGNFKAKLGFKNIDNMSEQQLEKENKNILEELRKAYYRITDGVVNEGNSFLNGAKPIKAKAFIGNEIISSFAEMALVKTYVSLLENEEAQFNQLKDLLKGIPVYDNFLCNIEGCQVELTKVVPVYYKNLYSEVYKQGLPGDSTVDDLTKRVKGFIGDYAIPFIDKPFALDYGIYVSEDQKTYSLLLDLSEEPKDPDFFQNNVGKPGKYASVALISNIKGQLNVEAFLTPRQIH